MAKTEKSPLKQTAVLQTKPVDSWFIPEHGRKDTKEAQAAIDEGETSKETKFQLGNVPTRSLIVLLLCTLGSFNDGWTFTVLSPFYPQEAAKKGMSGTVTGVVFGTFEFAFILSIPIFSTYINQLGPKFLYIAGIVVGGCGCIGFGFVIHSPSGAWFTTMSICVRCLQGIGMAASFSTAFAILATEFPNDVITVYGIVMSAQAMGLTIGPAVGGGLYQVGGFGAPMFLVGGMVLLNGALIWAFLPGPEKVKKDETGSFFGLLRSPLIVITMLSLCTHAIALTFIEPTLGKHVEKFELSHALIGLLLVISPSVNALTAPVWGRLLEKNRIESVMITLGCVIGCIGMLLIGPSPILPFIPYELWILILGLAVFGISTGMMLLAGMRCLINGAAELGFEDNLQTYGMVSGLFSISFGLGCIIGPVLGGFMDQQLGFPTTSSILAAAYICLLVVTSVLFLFRRGIRQSPKVLMCC